MTSNEDSLGDLRRSFVTSDDVEHMAFISTVYRAPARTWFGSPQESKSPVRWTVQQRDNRKTTAKTAEYAQKIQKRWERQMAADSKKIQNHEGAAQSGKKNSENTRGAARPTPKNPKMRLHPRGRTQKDFETGGELHLEPLLETLCVIAPVVWLTRPPTSNGPDPRQEVLTPGVKVQTIHSLEGLAVSSSSSHLHGV